MQKYFNNVTNRHGDAVSGATVTVTTSGGALATIYSDDGVTPQANPITTNTAGEFSFYAADGAYSVATSGPGIPTKTVSGIQLLGNASVLAGWALTQAFRLVSATRNIDGAATTASIVWPDGATGTYTADTLSTDFPGATDAWHATYVVGGTTKTVTQPAVTRDVDGNVTAQPAITIS
jgi:hypothetical protein